jgi:hypothetical protein
METVWKTTDVQETYGGRGWIYLAGFCEHGNEHLYSIKCGELLYELARTLFHGVEQLYG